MPPMPSRSVLLPLCGTVLAGLLSSVPRLAAARASLSLPFSQREHQFFHRPHLGKHVGQASILIPGIIRKVSIISTSKELRTTVSETIPQCKTNEQTNKHPS